jgi:hypothetical protein
MCSNSPAAGAERPSARRRHGPEARAPPFAEPKDVQRFTDRKSAATRIWNTAQRLGEALEEAMMVVEQDMLRAQQETLSATKAAKPAKVVLSSALRVAAPFQPCPTGDTTSLIQREP